MVERVILPFYQWAQQCSRSIKLAGDNMDFAISEYIKDKYQLIIGERTAEAIKMSLGSAVEVENESDMIVKGRDMTTGLPKTSDNLYE